MKQSIPPKTSKGHEKITAGTYANGPKDIIDMVETQQDEVYLPRRLLVLDPRVNLVACGQVDAPFEAYGAVQIRPANGVRGEELGFVGLGPPFPGVFVDAHSEVEVSLAGSGLMPS